MTYEQITRAALRKSGFGKSDIEALIAFAKVHNPGMADQEWKEEGKTDRQLIDEFSEEIASMQGLSEAERKAMSDALDVVLSAKSSHN